MPLNANSRLIAFRFINYSCLRRFHTVVWCHSEYSAASWQLWWDRFPLQPSRIGLISTVSTIASWPSVPSVSDVTSAQGKLPQSNVDWHGRFIVNRCRTVTTASTGFLACQHCLITCKYGGNAFPVHFGGVVVTSSCYQRNMMDLFFPQTLVKTAIPKKSAVVFM